MGGETLTPGEVWAAVCGALDGHVGPSRASGVRPVQPTKAPRSTHDGSWSVVVEADLDAEVKSAGGGGSRPVVYGVTVTLLQRTKNPGTYPEALAALYEFADAVFSALMSEEDAGGSFRCVPLEFVSMSAPEQLDAEYRLDMRFTVRAVWAAP